MTQIVLIKETSAVKTESKTAKLKREASERAAKKREEKAAKKAQEDKLEAERKAQATRWHRTNEYSPWPEYPANTNKQSI